MANGTIAFDTLTTSDSVNTNTEKSIDTSYLFNGIPKAWANFNESDSTIRDDFNVTSLTDNATGYFTINLTISMSSDDYVRTGSAGENANTGGNRVLGLRLPATNSFNIITKNTGGTDTDTADTCVTVLGDLA
tara:strand:- start:20 stop:418 length:399 start_codon:yes stop_codon:yes gene_type:complete